MGLKDDIGSHCCLSSPQWMTESLVQFLFKSPDGVDRSIVIITSLWIIEVQQSVDDSIILERAVIDDTVRAAATPGWTQLYVCLSHPHRSTRLTKWCFAASFAKWLRLFLPQSNVWMISYTGVDRVVFWPPCQSLSSHSLSHLVLHFIHTVGYSVAQCRLAYVNNRNILDCNRILFLYSRLTGWVRRMESKPRQLLHLAQKMREYLYCVIYLFEHWTVPYSSSCYSYKSPFFTV